MKKGQPYKFGDQIEEVKIEEYFNSNYREYSFHSLMLRGIPSIYDCLANVQRILIENAGNSFQATGSLVGQCIAKGYHHGEDSLSGCVNRMARTYNTALNLLEGNGFFGNSIAEAAAPRYTKCRINSIIKSDLDLYKQLNNKQNIDYFRLSYPIGLLAGVLGIGVGYRSQILPRKKEDILSYLNGKDTDLKPYFAGFSGKIERKSEKTWSMYSNIETDKNGIKIIDLPPTMNYDTFLENLGDVLDNFGKVSITNSSKTHVDIYIRTNSLTSKEKTDLVESIKKITKFTISEDYLFVYDDKLIRYENLKDYLDDFKTIVARNDLELVKYDINENDFEILFSKCKIKFLEFMLNNRNIRRAELMDFINNKLCVSTDEKLRARILAIPAYKVNEEEIVDTKEEISVLEKEKAKLSKNEESITKRLIKLEKVTRFKSLVSSDSK